MVQYVFHKTRKFDTKSMCQSELLSAYMIFSLIFFRNVDICIFATKTKKPQTTYAFFKINTHSRQIHRVHLTCIHGMCDQLDQQDLSPLWVQAA